MKRFWEKMRHEAHLLVRLHDTPHSIAGGTAVGVFFGFTPFLGLKTLLGIAVAWGFRCSRVAAAVGVALHDLVIPLMPFLLRIEYGIGRWILSRPHQWPETFHIEHVKIHQWLHWKVFWEVIWPTFIGSLVIGIPAAALAFWLMLRLVSRFQTRQFAASAAALGVDTREKKK